MDVNLEEEYLRGFVAGAKVPNAGERLVIDSLALAELRAELTAAEININLKADFIEKTINDHAALYHENCDLKSALTASQAETAAAYEAGRADALSGPWEDKPDVLTAAVEAAHPHYTKDYKTYTEALDLVSNRHGKGALVGLVNYLLAHNKAIISAIATPAARKAALDRMIDGVQAEAWQPIETAPNTRGVRIIGWCVFAAGAEAREVKGYTPLDHPEDYVQWFYGSVLQNVTHWQPLPPIPKGKDNE